VGLLHARPQAHHRLLRGQQQGRARLGRVLHDDPLQRRGGGDRPRGVPCAGLQSTVERLLPVSNLLKVVTTLVCAGLGCAGLGCAGLGWVVLGWVVLGWAGLCWAGLVCARQCSFLIGNKSRLVSNMSLDGSRTPAKHTLTWHAPTRLPRFFLVFFSDTHEPFRFRCRVSNRREFFFISPGDLLLTIPPKLAKVSHDTICSFSECVREGLTGENDSDDSEKMKIFHFASVFGARASSQKGPISQVCSARVPPLKGA
jgi:hypothetical protein